MSNPSTNKPLTFAAMLVRAQRRFEAMGRPFPSTRLATGLAVRRPTPQPADLRT